MANLEWTSELDQEVRDLGNYVEKQMKDLLNTNAGVKASALRIAFRHAFVGSMEMDRLFRYEGIDYTNFGLSERKGWLHDLKMIADLADANGSDAADKIKKALPVATQLTEEFAANKVEGMFNKIRYAKSKGIQY